MLTKLVRVGLATPSRFTVGIGLARKSNLCLEAGSFGLEIPVIPDQVFSGIVSGHWRWAILAQNLKRCSTKKTFSDFCHKGVSGSSDEMLKRKEWIQAKKKKKKHNSLKTTANSKAHESQELVGRQADDNVRRCFSKRHFAKSSFLHTELPSNLSSCLFPGFTKLSCECSISLLFLFKKTDASF